MARTYTRFNTDGTLGLTDRENLIYYSHDMKKLEQTFIKNCDACGPHTFTQLRREGDAAMYRRNRVSDGSIHTYEVFLVKTVKAGAPLPGGGVVAEDYERYPGNNSFGRYAWSISWGPEGLSRANTLFDELIKKALPIVEIEEEDTEIVHVVRIGKPAAPRRKLDFPLVPFTQKELAARNGIENYKEVYTDLQRFLGDGTLIKYSKRESTRGKSAVLFATRSMIEKLATVVAVEA